MSSIETPTLESLLSRLFGMLNYERRELPARGGVKTDAIRELLHEAGDPQSTYDILHVAGTKGKGSITRLSAALLNAANIPTGSYTSPHLETFHERIELRGQPIGDADLRLVLQRLFELIDRRLEWYSLRRLTFFDVATAAAFAAFQQAKLTAAAVEVGLGGRLDSTNVCQPQVCVISNISLDHTRQLGDTPAEIAREKAGIIKPGIPVLSGVRDPDAQQVIRQIASERESPLFELGLDFGAENASFQAGETRFDWWSDLPGMASVTGVELGLIGQHQVDNAALAIQAALLFNQVTERPPLPGAMIRNVCRQFRHAGRLEVVRQRPWVLLDVAHNAASTQALVESLQLQSPTWRDSLHKYLIVAISRDKDRAAILRQLLPHFSHVVFTQFCNNPRATPVAELAELAAEILLAYQGSKPTLETCPDPVAAWEWVRNRATTADSCVIAGSLFLVAELRPLLMSA